MGKTPFVIYQGPWSILERDLEREIIPMLRAHGMALAPWNVLAGGKIRTDAEEQRRRETGEKGMLSLVTLCFYVDWCIPLGRQILTSWERTEDQRKVCLALEKVAEEVGTKSIQAVAIAWAMQKVPYVFPIIGGRKVEHLHQNIEALDIVLTEAQIKYLEGILPFDLGFPTQFFVSLLCCSINALDRSRPLFSTRVTGRSMRMCTRSQVISINGLFLKLSGPLSNGDSTYFDRFPCPST